MTCRKLYIYLWCVTTLVCVACNRQAPADVAGTRPVTLKYARLLHLAEADSFTLCDVLNPWREGTVLHRYVLVPAASPLPSKLPQGTLLRTPLRRAVAFSSVHASLLRDLGCLDRLCGLCDTAYVVLPALRQALRAGQIADMGAALQPDRERLAAADPDALLVSPFQNAGYGGLEQLNVPLVECADYMEASPLGRAEWMRFYGRLFGCTARADSLFANIAATYEQLQAEAAKAPTRPTVLVDHMQSGTWYVPGGRSTMGQLYADAGARYLFSDLQQAGSVSLSFETVLARARDADFWFTKYGAARDLTYATLAADYPPYRQFRAWQTHRIYQCNVSRTPYFELAPFRPDLLLRDVVSIVHPDLLPRYHRLFYQPMQP